MWHFIEAKEPDNALNNVLLMERDTSLFVVKVIGMVPQVGNTIIRVVLHGRIQRGEEVRTPLKNKINKYCFFRNTSPVI